MAAAALHDDSRGDDEVYHRDNIFEFFRNHTAYDMLPESGKVRPHAPCGRARRMRIRHMHARRGSARVSRGRRLWRWRL